jgi:hypothetical protein
MIPITPQIIGPGIDEEYADALERIEKLEAALKGVNPSNDTREGRMVYQLMWLRQELTARRLPLPLDDKYWGTLGYLVAEGSLDHLGIAKPMGELARILSGTGMLKKRHYPVVVAMLDDLLTLTQRATQLDANEQQMIEDIRAVRAAIGSGQPLPFDKTSFPAWKAFKDAPNLEQLPGYLQQRRNVGACVFEEWRAPLCHKGPLPAPNPGLVWGGP